MPRIIVLDEDRSRSGFLKDALVSMGHTVDCTQSVPECLTLLNDRDCDLLITDFFTTAKGQLTPVSGATLIIAVRYCEAVPNGLNVDPSMPIIAMSDPVSGAESTDPLDFCAALGASNTIRKPLRIGELQRVIDEALCA